MPDLWQSIFNEDDPMNSITMGWKLGGQAAARLALVYMMLALLALYLQTSGNGAHSFQLPEGVLLPNFVGSGAWSLLTIPLLLAVPLGLAWLCGSVGGFMTGLLAPLLGNPKIARTWGMFCFFVPSLVFHNAADLRPQIVLGEHWLNAYWFWIGVPTVITVLVGGWVGEQLSGRERQLA